MTTESKPSAVAPVPSLCVVTVTLNAAAPLPTLIASLQAQSDHDFAWAVFDGGSTDGTVELIRNCGLPGLRLTCGRDFGIYDALNQCLETVEADYYVVCGADDELSGHAIASYRSEARTSGADVISANVIVDGHVRRPRRGQGWLYGMEGIASSHAVGMAIRRDLHQRFGKYSRKLPITADQLFIKAAHQGGASFHYADFVAGRYGTGGVSGSDMAGMLTEAFRVQRLTEKNKLLQVALFMARLLRHYRRL